MVLLETAEISRVTVKFFASHLKKFSSILIILYLFFMEG